MIINGPNVWPNSGILIPIGSMSSMSLGCVSGYATQGVLELDDSKTPCRYDAEGLYNQESCLSRCKRYYVGRNCDCYPSFLFATSTKLETTLIGADDSIINISLFGFQPPAFASAPSRISSV